MKSIIQRFRERFTEEWWMGFGTTKDINHRGIEAIESFLLTELQREKMGILERIEEIIREDDSDVMYFQLKKLIQAEKESI